MAETTQWEYRAESLGTFWSEAKDEQIEAILNEWGAVGWEVVAAYPAHGGNKVVFIAKRPLTTEARRRRSWPES